MLRYLLGVLLVCTGVAAWALNVEQNIFDTGRPTAWLLGMLVALPLGTSWLVAEAVDRWSPRLAFDRRVRRGWGLFIAGVASAALGYVIATLMLAVVAWLPDWGVIFVSAGCTSGLVLMVSFGSRRKGACVRCLYELGDGQSRCPECGSIGSRA